MIGCRAIFNSGANVKNAIAIAATALLSIVSVFSPVATAPGAIAAETAGAPKVVTAGPFASPQGLQISIRAEGPATRETALQIACFFKYEGANDVMIGGTAAFDEKMGGLVKHLRESGKFGGNLAEVLVLDPPTGTAPAKKLLLMGLGDRKTFDAARMRVIGRAAVREAIKAGVVEFSMSPNVTDAGVTTVAVGDFDKQLVAGVLDGLAIQQDLHKSGLVPAVVLKEFALEAGAKNIAAAVEAVKGAIAESESR